MIRAFLDIKYTRNSISNHVFIYKYHVHKPVALGPVFVFFFFLCIRSVKVVSDHNICLFFFDYLFKLLCSQFRCFFFLFFEYRFIFLFVDVVPEIKEPVIIQLFLIIEIFFMVLLQYFFFWSFFCLCFFWFILCFWIFFFFWSFFGIFLSFLFFVYLFDNFMYVRNRYIFGLFFFFFNSKTPRDNSFPALTAPREHRICT